MFAEQELKRLAERKHKLIAKNDQWRRAAGMECEHLQPTLDQVERGIEFARNALTTFSMVMTLVQAYATVREANATASPWWVRTLRLWRSAQNAAKLLQVLLSPSRRRDLS
jgi:hypothetical protein